MLDLLATRPKLKANLQFVVQVFGDDTCCILEDPVREKFWRIGMPEWNLLRRFDGVHNVAEVMAIIQEAGDDSGLDAESARTVVTWAIQEGLVDNLRANREPGTAARWAKTVGSAAFFRFRLGNPQRFLERLYPLIGFLTDPKLMIAWLGLLIATAMMLIPRWEEFTQASFTVIDRDQWWHFLLIWWGLKVVHEVFHGLTCLRYRGTVKECGVLFLLFAPLGAYVDVTSSWRFSSKWKRIHVTFAGIYVELAIAACAALTWCYSNDPLTQQLCLQTFLLASVATIFFNANPLIRFDGYYVLSDMLEIPNLYQQGQLSVRAMVSRLFLGRLPRNLPTATRHPFIVFTYGTASALWRITLCVGIAVAAANLLDGAGLILAFLLVLIWLGIPVLQLVRFLCKQFAKEPVMLVRATVASALLLGLGYILVARLPLPRYFAAHGVVQPGNSTMVRVEAAGVLQSLQVRPGQTVAAGETLAVLRNPELDMEVITLQQDLRRTELRVDALAADGLIAESQAEEDVVEELRDQLDRKTRQQSRLLVQAPHAGTVMDFNLDDLVGRVMKRGDFLMDIADPDDLEFRFSVAQSDHMKLADEDLFTRSVRVFVPGQSPVVCPSESVEIDPQAKWDLPDAALSAEHGGPIAVAAVMTETGQTGTRSIEPLIHGRVVIAKETELVPGMVGVLRFSAPPETIVSMLKPWFDRQVNRLLPELFK